MSSASPASSSPTKNGEEVDLETKDMSPPPTYDQALIAKAEEHQEDHRHKSPPTIVEQVPDKSSQELDSGKSTPTTKKRIKKSAKPSSSNIKLKNLSTQNTRTKSLKRNKSTAITKKEQEAAKREGPQVPDKETQQRNLGLSSSKDSSTAGIPSDSDEEVIVVDGATPAVESTPPQDDFEQDDQLLNNLVSLNFSNLTGFLQQLVGRLNQQGKRMNEMQVQFNTEKEKKDRVIEDLERQVLVQKQKTTKWGGAMKDLVARCEELEKQVEHLHIEKKKMEQEDVYQSQINDINKQMDIMEANQEIFFDSSQETTRKVAVIQQEVADSHEEIKKHEKKTQQTIENISLNFAGVERIIELQEKMVDLEKVVQMLDRNDSLREHLRKRNTVDIWINNKTKRTDSSPALLTHEQAQQLAGESSEASQDPSTIEGDKDAKTEANKTEQPSESSNKDQDANPPNAKEQTSTEKTTTETTQEKTQDTEKPDETGKNTSTNNTNTTSTEPSDEAEATTDMMIMEGNSRFDNKRPEPLGLTGTSMTTNTSITETSSSPRQWNKAVSPVEPSMRSPSPSAASITSQSTTTSKGTQRWERDRLTTRRTDGGLEVVGESNSPRRSEPETRVVVERMGMTKGEIKTYIKETTANILATSNLRSIVVNDHQTVVEVQGEMKKTLERMDRVVKAIKELKRYTSEVRKQTQEIGQSIKRSKSASSDRDSDAESTSSSRLGSAKSKNRSESSLGALNEQLSHLDAEERPGSRGSASSPRRSNRPMSRSRSRGGTYSPQLNLDGSPSPYSSGNTKSDDYQVMFTSMMKLQDEIDDIRVAMRQLREGNGLLTGEDIEQDPIDLYAIANAWAPVSQNVSTTAALVSRQEAHLNTLFRDNQRLAQEVSGLRQTLELLTSSGNVGAGAGANTGTAAGTAADTSQSTVDGQPQPTLTSSGSITGGKFGLGSIIQEGDDPLNIEESTTAFKYLRDLVVRHAKQIATLTLTKLDRSEFYHEIKTKADAKALSLKPSREYVDSQLEKMKLFVQSESQELEDRVASDLDMLQDELDNTQGYFANLQSHYIHQFSNGKHGGGGSGEGDDDDGDSIYASAKRKSQKTAFQDQVCLACNRPLPHTHKTAGPIPMMPRPINNPTMRPVVSRKLEQRKRRRNIRENSTFRQSRGFDSLNEDARNLMIGDPGPEDEPKVNYSLPPLLPQQSHPHPPPKPIIVGDRHLIPSDLSDDETGEFLHAQRMHVEERNSPKTVGKRNRNENADNAVVISSDVGDEENDEDDVDVLMYEKGYEGDGDVTSNGQLAIASVSQEIETGDEDEFAAEVSAVTGSSEAVQGTLLIRPMKKKTSSTLPDINSRGDELEDGEADDEGEETSNGSNVSEMGTVMPQPPPKTVSFNETPSVRSFEKVGVSTGKKKRKKKGGRRV